MTAAVLMLAAVAMGQTPPPTMSKAKLVNVTAHVISIDANGVKLVEVSGGITVDGQPWPGGLVTVYSLQTDQWQFADQNGQFMMTYEVPPDTTSNIWIGCYRWPSQWPGAYDDLKLKHIYPWTVN